MRLKLRVGVLMRERGMTVADLARDAGIATNTARALARGMNTRLDLDVLTKVAAALKVRPMEIFEETDEPMGPRVPTQLASMPA
jgi:DNA-binding Xre family transcriptional regulator